METATGRDYIGPAPNNTAEYTHTPYQTARREAYLHMRWERLQEIVGSA